MMRAITPQASPFSDIRKLADIREMASLPVRSRCHIVRDDSPQRLDAGCALQ